MESEVAVPFLPVAAGAEVAMLPVPPWLLEDEEPVMVPAELPVK